MSAAPTPTSTPQPTGEPVDVVILTAIPEEYAAVLEVEEGAWPGSRWEERAELGGFTVAFRDFQAEGGGRLRVAVTWATRMGQVATTGMASLLVETYRPRCLAMCGVCAGRKGKVGLGDVIIADLLWEYDHGKRETKYPQEGVVEEHFQGRQLSYSLDGVWKHKAERFKPAADSKWLAERPRTSEAQEDWVLTCLNAGMDPREHPERATRCANFAEVLKRLRAREHIIGTPPELTEAGKKYIQGKLYDHPDGLPESSFQVHVGPIATGNAVVKDKKIFEKLSERDYKVLGLEMEAAAIGALAELRGLDYMVVMKGVMDFADPAKDDNFKTFAARASAECLLAFLRQNLPAVEPDKFTDILEPGTDKRPETPSPTQLLNGRYQYVKFSHREQELSDLQSWCQDSEPVRARLYYGDGGMGKSRLFAEFCARLDPWQWVAGFLVKPHDEGRFKTLLEGDRDALVVIDYAESRQNLSALLESVARKRSTGRRGRLRVILLSRVAGGWFEHLLGSNTAIESLLSGQDKKIEPLARDPQTKQGLFREAVECFAEVLGKPTPAVPPALDLSHERFQRVLFIHMVALAAVEGWELKTDLAKDIIKHEERFWLTARLPMAPSSLGSPQFIERVRRAAAALTLVGGATRQEARRLIESVNGGPDDELLDLLSRVYPGKAHTHISGVEPDLLGEALVERAVGEEGDGGKEFLSRVFAATGAEGKRNGIAVFGRTNSRELEQQFREAIRKAIEAGNIELAKEFYAAGLPEHTVNLREFALWVTQTVLAHLPQEEDIDTQARRAELLNNLGNRQSDLGQREQALASTQEAVDIYRTLASRNPDSFLPDLAMSLNNLGNRQSDLGQREQALASTQQAVDIRRTLASRNPDAFLPDLAASLNNLGNVQSDLGQREPALASTQQAVDTYRTLASRNPDAFLPDLAMSLNSLGIRQSALGQQEPALASTQEALDLLWPFFERLPRAFSDRADIVLQNIRRHLEALGRTPSQQLQERLAFHAAHLPRSSQYTGLSALELAKQKWKDEERTLGSDHASAIAALRAYALQLKQEGYFAEARPFLERVAEWKHKRLGESHPETLAAMGEVADLYQSLGLHQKAKELHEQIRAVSPMPVDSSPPGPTPARPEYEPKSAWPVMVGMVLVIAALAFISRC